MKDKIPILSFVLALTFLTSCAPKETTLHSNESSIEISGVEFHTTMPSGLNIDAYELEAPPSTEPLVFIPAGDKTQDQILAAHEEQRKERFLANSYYEAMSFSMKTQLGEQELIAHEVYTPHDEPKGGSLASASIEVVLDNEVIFTADAGQASPITPLRGLWSYDRNWVLEYANITETYDEEENTAFSTVIGNLIKNGISINQQYSYDEVFGFQLMNNKPFYFYEKDGQIGISLDDREIMLGFQKIPHYGCCSAGILNPNQAKNMVSFFMEKDDTWYYVEIGVYE